MDRVSALTTLEEQVIRMLLAGDDAILSSLRDQAEHLTVSSREMTASDSSRNSSSQEAPQPRRSLDRFDSVT
jgi:hypothetical protein